MPNWCANRLTFSGVQHNTDDLRAWIKGEKSSLPGRAKREGIQLFLAGCAGLLRPETDMPCPVFPALTAHGVATESTPASQAFTRWQRLDEYATSVIERLYRQKGSVALRSHQVTCCFFSMLPAYVPDPKIL